MKETAINQAHHGLKAKMVDFAGWEMPLQYSSIIKEHKAVREKVGLFDVSHMGDVIVEGRDAKRLMDYLFTQRVSKYSFGDCIYTHLLNENGGIIDDMIIYPIEENRYFFIPNAARTGVVFDWLRSHANDLDVDIKDHTEELCCFALQGPRARKVMERIADEDIHSLKFFKFGIGTIKPDGMIASKKAMFDDENMVIISSTGYTGEDGFELSTWNKNAPGLWKMIMDVGSEFEIEPIGLGARDSLRLEKGFLLSGTDFDEGVTTIETGWDMVIDWDHDFIGKEALESMKNNPARRILFGVEIKGSGLPRHGQNIFIGNEPIGEITSGGYSPMIEKGIGLGFIPKEMAKKGTDISIEIRGKKVPAVLRRPPFC